MTFFAQTAQPFERSRAVFSQDCGGVPQLEFVGLESNLFICNCPHSLCSADDNGLSTVPPNILDSHWMQGLVRLIGFPFVLFFTMWLFRWKAQIVSSLGLYLVSVCCTSIIIILIITS